MEARHFGRRRDVVYLFQANVATRHDTRVYLFEANVARECRDTYVKGNSRGIGDRRTDVRAVHRELGGTAANIDLP